jgi:hypothetical protein
MGTPAAGWMAADGRLSDPVWVLRKVVALCKSDQKRGGSIDVVTLRARSKGKLIMLKELLALSCFE